MLAEKYSKEEVNEVIELSLEEMRLREFNRQLYSRGFNDDDLILGIISERAAFEIKS